MENLFLSIVIPVYNGEKSINRCLESIWSQNLPDLLYEVICVNDCSTDNTLENIKSIQKHHSNLIIVSNSENLRPGGSRNYGVRIARGEYILFMDADDYYHPNSLNTVFKYQLQYRYDIVMCDFARHTLNNPNDILVHNFPYKQVMTGREFLVKNSLPHSPWKYFFKKELMIDNEVYFEEKISCEDVDWTHKIVFYAKTMQYKPILLTHYIIHNLSQTALEYKNSNNVFPKLYSGYRVSLLLSLCETKEEKDQICRVAKNIFSYGLLNINGLKLSPYDKKNAIVRYIRKDIDWGVYINTIRDNPLTYSVLSTIISPIFLLLVSTKRKILGR